MKLLLVDINGTITRPTSGKEFVSEEAPTEIELLPGVSEALKSYQARSFIIVGVSNQGGIAAGHRTHASVQAEMQATLKLAPETLYILYCPDFAGEECWAVHRDEVIEHHPEFLDRAFPSYRKPEPGMLQLVIDAEEFSWVITCDAGEENKREILMVGDRDEDKLAAIAAGVPFMDAETWRTGAG